jgi:hypothetical protein
MMPFLFLNIVNAGSVVWMGTDLKNTSKSGEDIDSDPDLNSPEDLDSPEDLESQQSIDDNDLELSGTENPAASLLDEDKEAIDEIDIHDRINLNRNTDELSMNFIFAIV